ncbi:DUF6701 domain-containing protein [Vibrio sp. LaRot3]|uniref:DUF6701 domain-containing protein n=1 Tax=Vibrio sp. LaRot3 TaxID=2998829 RepID=UPI0022CDEADD|nr:DUF6701 domain-containing protein [Vibrio sp. LaRot3]MDA0148576.1 hypothetical protein [Vibrio sp. LaRot3]
MKQILWMLVLSLVSFSSWADDDEIRTCNVKLNKDFSIFVDYGEVGSLSTQDADDDDDDDFEEEVLYITTRDSKKPIKLWSNDDDEKDAIFYDPRIDDDKHAEIRIDFAYNSHQSQSYIGEFTYYLKQSGKWVEQSRSSQVINIGTKKAQALIENDDDRDELHNLRCDSNPVEPVDPPVFSLDICPYVPNTVQTNNVYQIDPNDPDSVIPHGALQVSPGSGNYVQVSDFKDEFFLIAQTGTQDCRFPDGTYGDCKTTTDLPVENFPPTLVWAPTSEGSDKSCEDGKEYNCRLKPGTYKDVTVKEDKTLTLEGGVYYFKTLKFAEENVALEILGPTEIHYKYIHFEKSGVKINAGSNKRPSEDLLILGHGKYSHFYPKNDADNITINGYVYVDHLAESDDNGFNFSAENNNIVGGVTAHSIALSGRNNTIQASNKLNCFEPLKPKIASINIVPNNFHLTCEDTKKVYVEVFDKDGQKITDVGDDRVSLSSKVSGALSFTYVGFDQTNGRFEFNLGTKSNHNYEAVAVEAHVVADSSIKDTSDVVFVPLKFDVNGGDEKQLIAGKSEGIIINTLACSSDGTKLTGNYSKTLTQANLVNKTFNPGAWSDSQGDLTFLANGNNWANGSVLASVQFNDAGQYTGELIDTISCDDFGANVQDCPSGQTQTIKGELKFKARPWTFAICDYASNSGGDASGGDAFLQAGKEFDLTVKPVIYSSSLDSYRLTQKAKADEFCKLPVTDNFFKNDPTYNSKVVLSHSVATPLSSDGGKDGSLSYAGAQNNYAGTSSIPLSDISVTEVGSFNFAASGNDTSFYAGILGGIDIGQREIGRFYPSRFSITASSFQGESQQEYIAYMGQEFFLTQIMVGAYAFDSTSVLHNYHLFAPELQALFAAKGDSVVNNELRFSADLSAIKWSAPEPATGIDSYWILNDLDAQVTRSLVKTETVSGKKVMFTMPNGPFNYGSGTTTTDFGFTISGSDPVSFSDSSVLLEQAFPTQPTVRYGRMVMGSSGGTSEHTLNVPLRVEYWDGSAFIVNDDDDLSKLSSNASHVCKQILWQDDEDSGSDSALSGVSSVQSVSSGLYQGLQATPNSSNEREQARFWIMLDDTATTPVEHTSPQRLITDVDCGASGLNQPWLQYNWRGQGDEDPSTVATFGIFRGNDKVIFRAEPNLVGN